jgi:acyl carrier protein
LATNTSDELEDRMNDLMFRKGDVGQASPEDMVLVVREILANKFKRDLAEIKASTLLEEELGVDSMAMIEINIALEEQLATPMPEVAAPGDMQVRTVSDLARYVAARLAEKPAEGRKP